MDVEIDPDFDPTTPEGRAKINESVDDDREPLLKRPSEDKPTWKERIQKKYGKAADYVMNRIEDATTSKRPSYMKPENQHKEVELDDLSVPSRILRYAVDDLHVRFPKLNEALLNFRMEKNRLQIQNARLPNSTWYDVYQKNNTDKINNELKKRKGIMEGLGVENLSYQHQKVQETEDASIKGLLEIERRVKALKDENAELKKELHGK